MSSGEPASLLRAYQQWECGSDGYPQAWHLPSIITRSGTTLFGRDIKLVMDGNVREERPAIKDLIRDEAGHRCQRCGHPYAKGEVPMTETPDGVLESWSPCDEQCTHGGPIGIIRDSVLVDPGQPLPEEWPTGSVVALWRILTVHHLDSDKLNCRWWNLVALCQRCHLRMQRTVVMDRVYHYEHSHWFKPFAAAFYAWKYLGEDLDAVEVSERMDELLRLELRFRQETLFDHDD